MANLGLDKLAFLLPLDEVKLTPDFAPKIERGPINGKTLEPLPERVIYTVGGVPRCGRLAHFNTKDFQFAIRPNRERSGSVCMVQFSAGAFQESNLEPFGLDETCDAARQVQSDLKQNGVSFDFKLAKLVRLDIAQNCKMAYPVAAYAPALASVGARKRVRKVEFGVTGFYIGNKSLEIGFYDKAEQMKKLGYAPHHLPVNGMRPEVRLQKARLIREALSCSSLAELPNAWPQLRPAYNHFLKRDVFRARNEKTSGAALEMEPLAALAVSASPSRAFQHFAKRLALLTLVHQHGIGAAKHFVSENFGYDATTESGQRQIERVHAELEAADFALKHDVKSRTEHKVKELYKELRDRVLGPR